MMREGGRGEGLRMEWILRSVLKKMVKMKK